MDDSEVFNSVGKKRLRVVVGGVVTSVGAAEWVMGGGHTSVLSPTLGLGTVIPICPDLLRSIDITVQLLTMFSNLLSSLPMDIQWSCEHGGAIL